MKKILVPTDFTDAAANALEHAASLAKVMEASVVALHVVAKENEQEAKQAQVNEQAAALAKAHGIEVEGVIRVGNIFDDIGETANEIGARLIIMGTHGLRGLQYIMGSYALRVITNSVVPFIVVQKDSGHHSFDKIVLPINIGAETKQKIKFAKEMAELFDSEVHILYQEESDPFLKKKLAGNLRFTKQYLTENRVRYTTKATPGGNFADEVVGYSESVGADLIAIMNLSDDHLIDLFGRSYEQVVITNKPQIPVMVINRKNVRSFGMSFMAG